MPRVVTIQTNFTGGEISPRLLGRVDIEKYPNACETLENTLTLIHGGCRNKYGSLYVAAAKNANKKTRVIPFIFSTTQAYILEFGDLYMRVYTNNAQVLSAPLTPFEIATPYTEAMLADIDYVQSADTMFLFHPTTPTNRLRRFGDASWDMSAAPFSVTPVDEIGDYFGVSLTLSASTVGAARTVTSSGPVFLAADVGRTITYLGGTLKITAFTDASHVTGDISTPFSSTSVPINVWNLTGTPQTTLTPSAATPFGGTITLTAGANAFRSTDIGKFIEINGGRVQITVFTDALHVNAVITQELTGTVASPANAWFLLTSVWNSTNGYPRTGTIHQQRLVVAGSPGFPQTFWGSSIGLYLDFTLSTLDDDGFAYTLGSDELNPIRHMVAGKVMVALTNGNEFAIKGGIEKPITPTNIQVDDETNYGSNGVRPVRVGKAMLYVQRSNTALMMMSYTAASDSYDSADITAMSEHITGDAVVDLSYARKPDPIVYAVRSDGVIAALTLSVEQNVSCWERWTTDGKFESVATIPTSTGDQTWAVVNRTINGSTVRYIERFDPDTLMDAAIVGTSGPGANVWTNLNHLEGKTVACIADGSDMGNFTVSSGQITLPRNAFAVTIGLPFTSTIKLLPPEIQTGTGTAQGQAMSTSEVSIRVLDTQGMKLNGKTIAFRQFGSDLLDLPPPTFTGVKRKSKLGWARGSSDITLTQDRPVPFHILSIIRTLTVNSGGSP